MTDRAPSPRLHPLVGFTCLALLLAIAGSAAHLTFTNLDPASRYRCVKGIVKNVASGETTESVPVCTGDMKPKTTIALEAPFGVGEIEKTCPGNTDRFGNRSLDWDKCTFNVVDVE